MATEMDFTDIEHHFDEKFYYGKMKNFTGRLLSNMFDKREIIGLEHLAKISNDSIIIYIMMHKSHLDYLILPYTIATETNRGGPAIAAGDNLLDVPIMGELLRKSKAFKIYRNPGQVPGKTFKEVLKQEQEYIATELFGKNEDCIFFPEGKRSYTGDLLMFNEAVINILLSAQVKSGKDIYFVPTAINYERVSEDRHFRTFEKYKRLKAEGKPSMFDLRIFEYAIEWFKYYALDVPMIYAQRYVRGLERAAAVFRSYGEAFYDPRRTTLGNMFLNIGEPRLVTLEEVKKGRKQLKVNLSAELRREVGRLVDILPSDLVARAFQTFAPSKEITAAKRKKVLAEMERLRESYINRGFRTSHIEGNIVDVYQRGMLVFASPFRRALYSYNGTISRDLRRKHIIAYYASRLSHFEEEGMSINETRTASNQEHSDNR
ncbi:1-acyl-sn-glycerol-3-phosphate acyltransferase [Candidatus Woesearchaeota archaeon]|nr:1-acyl-sn-glycerol-3-phosphate acyltransferase [Candidatus Woesearchaeota archaeon]